MTMLDVLESLLGCSSTLWMANDAGLSRNHQRNTDTFPVNDDVTSERIDRLTNEKCLTKLIVHGLYA